MDTKNSDATGKAVFDRNPQNPTDYTITALLP
jgi:hypothetical protein